MKTRRQFIVDTLLPYKNDISLCAIEGLGCVYLTKEGKTCAMGKHMVEGPWQKMAGTALSVFKKYGMAKVLTKEAFDQGLTQIHWANIQSYHDRIAMDRGVHSVNNAVKRLEDSTGLEFPELYL